MILLSFMEGCSKFILAFILFYQISYGGITYFIYHFYQVTDTVCVHRVSKFILGLNFIAICYSYVAHVVAKANKLCTLPIVPTCGRSCPCIYLITHLFILPMTNYNLAIDSHACHDETKLT